MDIKQAGTPPSIRTASSQQSDTIHRLWIGGYIVLSISCLVLYFLLRLDVFSVFGNYRDLLQKSSMGGFWGILILMTEKIAERFITKKNHGNAERYNLIRLMRLLSFVLIVLVIISFVFKEWYAAAVSLGLISLILGFALQTPISSFIGWLYIIVRKPYQVGDRIQLESFRGDVVEINYLDTTLWEFSGDYLSNDLPSGRLIRFPNSLIFQSAVYNYSWDKFPYIWNEIPFHIAYESDLPFVEEAIRSITKAELGEEMLQKVQTYKTLLAQTAVDELEIKDFPSVNFRINANTWVEVLVTYLVEPKRATAVRSNLIKKILAHLGENKEKVLFPNGNAR
ncbi:MAG: mechanosensitive ion channel [Cytophagales bacterium]|nr:mechanosensitive ion channel [Cytophaga sp.]